MRGALEACDFSDVEPRRIYFALHNRGPEKIERAVVPPNFAPIERYLRGLASEEFRKNIIPRFLEAFPEKQRLLFIHIPKTAGSELSARLTGQYPYLNAQYLQPGWHNETQFYAAIKRAVTGLASSQQILICGHNTLQRYRAWRAIRYGDRVFAVLREPAKAVLSQVNYVLTRIFVREKEPKPDTLGWRRIFGVSEPDAMPSKTTVVALAQAILRNAGVTPANNACRFLGGQTADAALERIVCDDVELTDTEHLDRWCKESWAIDRDTRSNVSKKFVAPEDFAASDRDYIAQANEEDSKLHRLVVERLAQRDAASVRGVQLA